MRIKLQQETHHHRFSGSIISWETSAPFCLNPRGKLIHRVRYVCSYIDKNGRQTHDAVGYWCGNHCTNKLIIKHLTEDPPQERLLCTFCEAKAIANGQLSASELAGRHVHTGRMVPKRTCCNDGRN